MLWDKTEDVMYLHLQKIYNQVSHEGLLKNESPGTAEIIFKWFEDWLSERKQFVVINVKSSNW